MNNVQVKKLWYRVLIVVLISLALFGYYKRVSAGDKNDEITIKVQAANNQISVSVKSAKTCELQFYMFNMDGLLIKQYDIKGSTMLQVSSLSKGIYTYDIFHKDAKLKSGKIELK